MAIRASQAQALHRTDPCLRGSTYMGGKACGVYLLGVGVLCAACGANGQTPGTLSHVSPPPTESDGGAQPTGAGGGAADATAGTCDLPSVPLNLCSALPTGKVTPCSKDNSGQPSQTGYLEIDGPGAAPMYVCATSWSPDPSVGYVFGEPATFLSDAKGCCGGAISATAAPTVPVPTIGSLGAPHVPDHIKPQETEQPGNGLIRQNPFAMAVTNAASGAAASQAISTWLSWAGDGQPHPAPDGTGAYYFASGFPVNYVVLETSAGFPVIVVGPEVSLTSDGKTPIGHPTLGVCPAGGGVALAMIAGELNGTTLNNHSGRFDYGPWVTADALDAAAQLFNCRGIQISGTKYDPPKMAFVAVDAGTGD